MATETARSLIADRLARPYLDTDPGWRQFVLDYRDEIKAAAKVYDVSAQLMNPVTHNVARFLDSIMVPTEIAWIVYVINDFASDIGFANAERVYVPDLRNISQLYSLYESSREETP